MGLSDAERARRSRAHRKGQHHLCDPERCPAAAGAAVTASVTEPVTGVTRDDVTLGPSGRRLWRELSGDSLAGGRRNLALEACRLSDRLDKLDDFLRGHEDTWMRFHSRNEDGSIVEVVVDKALAEARQQAVALKQIVAELRQGAGADKPATGGSILDQLAAKRAQRLANTAG